MEYYENQLFSIYYPSKYQNIIEKLKTMTKPLIEILKPEIELFEPCTFSLSNQIKDGILIAEKKENSMTPENVYQIILTIFFTLNYSSDCHILLSILINWILSSFAPINYVDFKTFYLSIRKKSNLKPYEEKYLIFVYLYEGYRTDIFSFLLSNQFQKEILIQEAREYFEDILAPNKQILIPENIANYMRYFIEYGWLDKEKNHHYSLKGWKENYVIHPVKEVLKEQIGNCIDMARVATYFLKQLNLETYTLFIKYQEEDKIHYHAIPCFKEDGIWCKLDGFMIEEMNSKEEFVQKIMQNDKVIDISELPDDIDNIPIQKLLNQTFGTTRKKKES